MFDFPWYHHSKSHLACILESMDFFSCSGFLNGYLLPLHSSNEDHASLHLPTTLKWYYRSTTSQPLPPYFSNSLTSLHFDYASSRSILWQLRTSGATALLRVSELLRLTCLHLAGDQQWRDLESLDSPTTAVRSSGIERLTLNYCEVSSIALQQFFVAYTTPDIVRDPEPSSPRRHQFTCATLEDLEKFQGSRSFNISGCISIKAENT